MESKIKHELALDFIFGGKSLFTVRNPNTDNRLTYKVKKGKDNDIYFVSVLSSGDDLYQYVGHIKKDMNLKHSNKSKVSINSMSFKVFDFLTKSLYSNNLPDFIEIFHHGRCARCSRILTVPDSIESGFGPECIKKSKK